MAQPKLRMAELSRLRKQYYMVDTEGKKDLKRMRMQYGDVLLGENGEIPDGGDVNILRDIYALMTEIDCRSYVKKRHFNMHDYS